MDKPYVKEIGKVKKFNIFSVDGKFVRNEIDDSFHLAGHSLYYNFIPEHEVWVEATTDKEEIKFLVAHELFERYLMSNGLDYDIAHNLANIVEAACRKHPERTKDVLSIV